MPPMRSMRPSRAAIEDGPRTGDLGGSDGTGAVAGFLLARIDERVEVPA